MFWECQCSRQEDIFPAAPHVTHFRFDTLDDKQNQEWGTSIGRLSAEFFVIAKIDMVAIVFHEYNWFPLVGKNTAGGDVQQIGKSISTG